MTILYICISYDYTYTITLETTYNNILEPVRELNPVYW